MKVCRECGLEQPLSEYCKDSSQKDGLHKNCKACRTIYRESRKELRALYWEKYYKSHSDQLSEYKRNYWKQDERHQKLRREKTRIGKFFRQLTEFKDRGRYIEWLGCTIQECIDQLQKTAIDNGYTDFNIYDYDRYSYHIDHYLPFKLYIDGDATLEEINHYKNIQILSSDDNLVKGEKLLEYFDNFAMRGIELTDEEKRQLK